MQMKWVVRVWVGLVLCGFGAVRAGAETYTGPQSGLHVYVLIGQSNMAGRAPIEAEAADVIARGYLLNGQDEWEPAKNPLNIYSTIRKGAGMQRLGPGYSFARKMLEDQPDVSIGLVVNAKGGTRIDEWGKGGKFYDEAVRRAKAAQKTGTLAGILWHQGESDNGNPAGYAEKLAKLVTDLRADLGGPDLPFVAGEVREGSPINTEIARLPEMLTNTAVVRSTALKTYDQWHFDAASVQLLGTRYAEAMLGLQRK